MLRVRTRDGFIEKFDPKRINESLQRDVEHARSIGVQTKVDQKTINRIVRRVVNKLNRLVGDVAVSNGDVIASDTIRGLTVTELIAINELRLARIVELTGMRSVDMEHILCGADDIDNANLQPNPETTHKRIADWVSKEYYLRRMPDDVAMSHLAGDIHIHDLEYFGTRPFCQDHDLRYFFYYGLMPDGNGNKASVSGPAMHPEVAILHAVKTLSAAQTNFAGGQGFYNFLTFLAPYLEGLDYARIRQLMQMFVYEMTQMMVARGGQVVFSSVQLTPGVPKIWRDRPAVYKGRVWNGHQAPRRVYGEFEREVRLAFEALMDVMLDGDYWGKPFYFPKPEVAIEPDFVDEATWDQPGPDGTKSYKDLYLKACTLAAKFGAPYFDNMLPAYRGHSKGGIACYQCLPGNERVEIFHEEDGGTRVETMQRLYEYIESLPGRQIVSSGPDGDVILLPKTAKVKVFSVDFDKNRLILAKFAGIKRQRYSGMMRTIFTNVRSGVTVTPDHPVYVQRMQAQRGDVFEKVNASSVNKDDMIAAIDRTDNSVKAVKVEYVLDKMYDGYVYDLINVGPAHCFVSFNGIIVGNCCAYNFSIDPYKDRDFDQKMNFGDPATGRYGKHFSMGSMQVVTINIPRAAYRASDVDDVEGRYAVFMENVKRQIDMAAKVFEIKREWISRQLAANRLPFITQRPLDPITRQRGEPAVDIDACVYTIGIVGMNEVVQVLTGHQLHEHDDAILMAERILNDMKMYILMKYGSGVALARTPAETVAQRFAVLDLMDERYRRVAMRYVKGDVQSAVELCSKGERDLPVYYTNGCMVNYGVGNIFTRIGVEHRFFPLVDGGNILHVFLSEEYPSPESILKLVMDVARKTLTGYFAITKDLTVCRDCGYVSPGLRDLCDQCRSNNVDQISRITGYLSAVSGWNAAKRQELRDRARMIIS